MRGTLKSLTTVAVALLVALLPACSHKGPADIATLASSSDEVVWEAGQNAAAKQNWESARQHYKRIVDGFPQSRHGPDARLALGDSYFKEGGIGNYILAISAYRDFLTLYPSHPKSDYAQYQVGEGFFLQKSGADRDQTNTPDAGSSPDGGAALVFDSAFDPAQGVAANASAAVTSVFYWGNVTHEPTSTGCWSPDSRSNWPSALLNASVA